jgi:hypothetical protein
LLQVPTLIRVTATSTIATGPWHEACFGNHSIRRHTGAKHELAAD